MKENEILALQLKSLLSVAAAVDSDNAAALSEIPIVLQMALEKAEKLYCNIVDKKEN